MQERVVDVYIINIHMHLFYSDAIVRYVHDVVPNAWP